MKISWSKPYILVYHQYGYEYFICCKTFLSAMKVFYGLQGIFQAEIKHNGKVFNVRKGKR